MGQSRFLFLGITLVVLIAGHIFQPIPPHIETIWAFALILIVGIPHGAVDHVSFRAQYPVHPIWFYVGYMSLVGLYLLSWISFPAFSISIFLLLSAFHFGQSQFSDLSKIPKWVFVIMAGSWGTSILSGLIFYHFESIEQLLLQSPDLSQMAVVLNYEWFDGIWRGSTIVAFGGLVMAYMGGYIGKPRLGYEIAIFCLIHICFWVLPLLVGFCVYFVVWHSAKVMGEDYGIIRSRKPSLTFWGFVKLLIPFTLFSIFGITMIIAISLLGWIQVSEILMVLVMLSILTLPHSIIMDGFYRQLYPSKPSL
ncbi:Brp/Blh family beta-carotene 15,15'-dioxygenase [Pontibacter sp. G13]|uniref:Brp/Blh family beta-carotene 15,15'-dioxygenase n=1 Tax=Pontibacter sp. G13 TaxID=3074898 RepID=UPI002889543E|nr:Brp/Blh family beta-carotene 15,15'-dioxygenase [Pontibacter sp. G13]WNJ15996.1 Brp/Blh family beta-carotene 15,15'-dioxygenase [Pontibacter sp. G13]